MSTIIHVAISSPYNENTQKERWICLCGQSVPNWNLGTKAQEGWSTIRYLTGTLDVYENSKICPNCKNHPDYPLLVLASL